MLPKRIVFVGSSSIHGHGDSQLGGFVNRFRLWYESASPGNRVYELGIFGETIESLIARLAPEAAARRPHLIVLYPGFNDIRRDGGLASSNNRSQIEFKASVEALVAAARSVSALLMMTGFPFEESRTTPYPGTNSYYLLKDANAYTDIIRSVCEGSEVPVLDYFSLWSCEDTATLLAEDGLHANVQGHQRLFEQLREFVLHKYA